MSEKAIWDAYSKLAKIVPSWLKFDLVSLEDVPPYLRDRILEEKPMPENKYLALKSRLEDEMTNRIILPVEIEGHRTTAVIDTGAPYVICEPRLARLEGFDLVEPLERITMLIRGMYLPGSIIRLSVTLMAERGDDLTVDATAFVPEQEERWENLPSFIGLSGFLERIRFALDPSTDTFYFGQLS
jgi:hypothetical protein